jgi:hypothetical protein
MAFSIEPAVQPAPLPSSQDQPITTNDQATKHGTSRRDEQETFWRWTTKDATGFYTFLLAAVTGGLALVAALQAGMFFWQLKLMHEGINDAKTAASTAATAAAAATTQAQELRRSADAAGMAGGSYGRSASRSDSMNAFLIGSPAPSCNAVTESYLGLQRSQGDATT